MTDFAQWLLLRRSEFILLRPNGMSWAHWRKCYRERRERAQSILTNGDARKKCAVCGVKLPLIEQWTDGRLTYCAKHYPDRKG